MGFNEEIKDLIKELTAEQNIIFALTCINRLKHLPQLFINSESYGIKHLDQIIPKNTIENILNEIINKLYNEPLKIKHNKLNKNIELLEKLLLDDEIETGALKNIFFYYVIIIIHILSYIKNNKYDEIYWCSNAVLEILNQMEYERYNNEHKNCIDSEVLEYVDLMIKNEMGKEKQIIKIIKTGNKKILDEYIKDNKIEYNIKK
jgi:hypothetical protein